MAKRKVSWKLEHCNDLDQLGDVDLDKLRRLFLSQDRSGTSKTTIYGLAKILKDPSLQMSEDAIAAFIAEFDIDRDGNKTMDICEFFDMIEANNFSEQYFKNLIQKAIIRQSAIRKQFVLLDENQDGYITTKQFRITMRKQKNVRVTEDEIDAMIKDADYDANGRIDYDEFALVLTE